jgi:hypothetical protein
MRRYLFLVFTLALVGLLGCAEVVGLLSTDLVDGVPQIGRRVFLTTITGESGAFALNTGSIDGPCQMARESAGLKRNYIAIVSTSTQNAKDRVTGEQKIYKVLGNEFVLVADSADQIWSGTPRLYSSIDTDESGVRRTTPANLTAWTGSTQAGIFNAGRSCTDWTDPGASPAGSIGSPSATDANWIFYGNSLSCNPTAFPGSRGVYCISI